MLGQAIIRDVVIGSQWLQTFEEFLSSLLRLDKDGSVWFCKVGSVYK